MKRRYVFGSLFAEPSLIEGMGSVVDIGATMQRYNESMSEREADIIALKNDWMAVGEDLSKSIKSYEQKEKKSKNS
ncbi:MAG: hypothetical protein H6779_00745 [Candidatus Nomurabacteria bacterium]|nr:hypothetical protein [Candidatus Nomurabacteria bacterium]USN87957.1 MAG: hypothetical protein H6779_00745 [Candidatus Nomurabacteria bacterium]